MPRDTPRQTVRQNARSTAGAPAGATRAPAKARARAPRPAVAPPVPDAPTVDVTAVLVSHEGAAWLPTALAALAASAVRPARVVLVDTGSADGSADLLRRARLLDGLEGAEVLELPPTAGFGEGVHAAVAHADAAASPTEWLWLLHDDCAPDVGALEALLAHAETTPSAAMLGPKALDWANPRVLVEVGLTTDGGGHRETGLERGEYDQGQHDAPRDVLAVGTAGALVRRAAWDQVGGLDPALALFRDDLDLGWSLNAAGHRVVVVPAARVRHVRAATTGRRTTELAPGRATGVDRRHALLVLLAHSGPLRLPLLVVRVVLAGVLRALGLLLTRAPLAARDEVVAVAWALAPGRLRSARARRAGAHVVPHRALRPLLADGRQRVRARLAAVGDWLSGGAAAPSALALGDPGPDADDVAELAPAGDGFLRRALVRPGTLLFVSLLVLALLAERSLLAVGGGHLSGGRLLPVPGGAEDLWASYLASWHQIGTGTDAPAPPSTAVLALLSTVLLGKPWLAIDVLLLASVPLAGAAAWWATGRVVRHRVLRLWASATWALLPVATGGVATGRIDVAAVQVALPLLLVGSAAVLRADRPDRAWRRAWGVGLGLALVVALSPALWPVAAVLLVGGGVVGLVASADRAAARRRALAAAVTAAVPLVALLPWSLHALADPSLLLHGPGRLVDDPSLVDRALPAWHLPLLSPGGAGLPAAWVTAGLLLAALGGLVRLDRSGAARAAWAVAGAGLLAALFLARTTWTAPGTDAQLPVWPGAPLQVAGAAMLLAALIAADGVRTRLAARAFGWRQLLAVVVAGAAAAAPVLAGVAWVGRGADGPLQRGGGALLPAFAQAELEAQQGLRVLVLERSAGGALAWELHGAAGPRLHTGGVAPQRSQVDALDAVVGDLLSARGSDAAEALSTRAVRFVVLADGERDALAPVLDAQPGLTRRTTGRHPLWQVVAPTGRLVVLPPAAASQATGGTARGPAREQLRTAAPVVVESGREAVRTTLADGPDNRLLVLAEAADDDWSATLDGRPLPRRTAWGWAQAFVLPADGGRLVLERDSDGRRAALAVQGVALLVLVVLAAPSARRRSGLEVDDSVVQADDAEPLDVPVRVGASSPTDGEPA